MQEIIISFVAAVVRKFMYDRHADFYPAIFTPQSKL
jgi:hypothetical protein